MALKGFSEDLAQRGVQTDLKYPGEAKAGIALMLGSQDNYLQLASQALTHVLDWEVTHAGLSVADQVLGVEKQITKSNEPARVRELKPGDLIRTDQLASAGATGPFSGTTAPNSLVAVDHATGKFRVKQAFDVELARVSPEGNFYNTDGSISLEIVALR